MRYLILLLALIGLMSPAHVCAQDSFCGSSTGGSQQQVLDNTTFPSYGGIWLPSTGTIKAYVVFVQFKDQSITDANWPANSLPNWGASFVASSVDQNGNYPTGSLSKRMYGFSNGALHVIGDYYPQVVLTDLNANEYSSYGQVNYEILQRIDQNVNFALYDNFNYSGDYDVVPGADNRVDLVILIYRSVPQTAPYFWWGIAELGFDSCPTNDNGRVIYGGAPGSGLTVAFHPNDGAGTVMPFDDAVGLAVHETSHFFFGRGHFIHNFATLGAMSDENGGSSFNSVERRWLGWMDFTYPSSDPTTVTLRDFFTTRDACAVQIGTSNQWFVIENRQRIDPLDKAPYPGVYVYFFDGYYWGGLDIVSADGRWNWAWNYSSQQAEKSSANPSTGRSKLQLVDLAGVDRKPPGFNGDSLDPFNFGYKTTLVPNANPSSYTRDGMLSNIAMQLVSANDGAFTIKIYKNAISGSVSGNIATNTVWAGNVIATGSVTVNSGVSLVILPGSTVSFANGTSLTVYGTLSATDATFTSSSTWSGIVISGTGANNSSLENCTIEHVLTYGGSALTVNGASGVKIHYCNISNNASFGTGGVSFIDAGDPEIYHNTISSNGGYGVRFYNTNGNIWENTITSNAEGGVYCNSAAHPAFGRVGYYYSTSKGNNTISGGYYGVQLNSWSSAYIGSTNNSSYGYNRITSTTTARVFAGAYCEAVAEQTWWGANPPDPV
ncbi:MAG: right-handed parallel beta-helix repeat-containing protein [Ignavibacteriales bacterium]|nr:right-handed parallel beta-helix repeat-containing protein [Ignavibacteriales bacterium]